MCHVLPDAVSKPISEGLMSIERVASKLGVVSKPSLGNIAVRLGEIGFGVVSCPLMNRNSGTCGHPLVENHLATWLYDARTADWYWRINAQGFFET